MGDTPRRRRRMARRRRRARGSSSSETSFSQTFSILFQPSITFKFPPFFPPGIPHFRNLCRENAVSRCRDFLAPFSVPQTLPQTLQQILLHFLAPRSKSGALAY